MSRTATCLLAVAILALAAGCGSGGSSQKAPVIASFEAFPLNKAEGDYRLLSWQTRYADRVAIYERLGTEGSYDYNLLFESDNALSTVMEYRVHGSLSLELRAFNTRSRHDPEVAVIDISPTVEEPEHLAAFYPEAHWVNYAETAVLNFQVRNATADMTIEVGLVAPGWRTTGTPLTKTIGTDGAIHIGQFTVDDCPAPTTCLLTIDHHKGFYAELYDGAGNSLGYAETSVGIFDAPLPVILDFHASDDIIVVGGSTNLHWEVHNATSVQISGFAAQFCDAWLECRGSEEVSPMMDTEYVLSAEGPGGTLLARVTVEVVTELTAPTIESFTATPTEIHPGSTVTLSWDTTLADSVDIVAVPADSTLPSTFTTDGTADVSPTVTTTYTLSATNTVGTNDQDVSVTVTPLAAGDLVISEIMVNPATVLDTDAEWFELYNHSTMEINLNGLTIADSSTSDTIDTDILVPAGGYALLALSSDTGLNDNLPAPDFIYSGLAFDETSAGSLSVSDSSTTIDTVAWDGSTWTATEGYSWSLSSTTLTATDNDTFTNWCNGASLWTGATSNYGSPGAANPSC
jgi:hypothetical protein